MARPEISDPQQDRAALWRGMICLSPAIGFEEDQARLGLLQEVNENGYLAGLLAMARVVLTYFTPFQPTTPARAKGCLTCTHFQGRFYCGHLLCERDGRRHVVGVPTMGCAFWEREPGADDE